jgi:Na+/H+-dicarboxylate symporter
MLVDEEVSSFVLPLELLLIWMVQVYIRRWQPFYCSGNVLTLDLNTQLMIAVTATLASIGSAAVPSAGMVICYCFRSGYIQRRD